MTDPTAATPDDSAAGSADDGPPQPSTLQRAAVELLGTFVYVLVGCAAIVFYGDQGGDGDIVAIALAFGLAYAVMASALGRVSGAHFNPALSLGAALAGRLSWRHALVHMGAQVLGAVLGAAVLYALLHGFDGYDADRSGLGQNTFGDDGTGYATGAAFLLELLFTALLVLVALAVTDGRHQHPALAPWTIGLALVVIHVATLPATFTSVNPARSIGPALFTEGDDILRLWLFVLAPLLGAAVAGAAYPALLGRDADPVPGSGLRLRLRRPASAGTAGTADHYQEQWRQQAWAGEPIIQDGWQWDPQAQQWVPAQQHPAQHPAQHDPDQQHPTQHDPDAPPAAQAQPEAGQWPDDGPTQVRPR